MFLPLPLSVAYFYCWNALTMKFSNFTWRCLEVCHSLYFPSRTLTPFVLHLAGHLSSVQNSHKKFGPFLKVLEMWSYLKHPWACLIYAKWFWTNFLSSFTAKMLLQFIFKYFFKKIPFILLFYSDIADLLYIGPLLDLL